MSKKDPIKQELSNAFLNNYKPNMSYEEAEQLLQYMREYEKVLRMRDSANKTKLLPYYKQKAEGI